MRIDLTTLIVVDYDDAIAFFTDVLGFDLAEDTPALTNDGRPKRWVVVRPPGAQTGLLLAQADGEHQTSAIGRQFAGRVGLFLRVDDFDATYERMVAHDVEFVSAPRDEPYGQVAVFVDVAGNRWDLLGPPLEATDDGSWDDAAMGWDDDPVARADAAAAHDSLVDILRERGGERLDQIPDTPEPYDPIAALSVCSFLDDYPATLERLISPLRPGGLD